MGPPILVENFRNIIIMHWFLLSNSVCKEENILKIKHIFYYDALLVPSCDREFYNLGRGRDIIIMY